MRANVLKRYAGWLVTVIALGGISYYFASAWSRHLGNVSFEFYGRIVDQNGRAIPGVTVNGEVKFVPLWSPVRPIYAPQHAIAVECKTDANGFFHFEHSGYSLDLKLENWVHPGWAFWNGGGGMAGTFGLSSNVQRLTDHATPTTAYVYEMVPAGSTESKWIMDRHYLPPTPR